MNAAIILNEEAGQGKNLAERLSQFRDEKFSFDLFTTNDGYLDDTLKKIDHENYGMLIAAGGDGTVSSVAGRAVRLGRIMGIIPAGTLNHFARDAGIPLDMDEAMKVIKNGNTALVDTASVNDHIFLNNSSIGLYPKVVKKREKEMRFGGNKWTALFKAVLTVFKSVPRIKVTIKADGQTIECKTPFVFIGNNDYKFDLFNLGRRGGLRDGRLSIYYPTYEGRISYVRLILKTLTGRLDQEISFRILHNEEIMIYSDKKRLEVSLDGEVIKMNTPLFYKINTKSLRLIIPG